MASVLQQYHQLADRMATQITSSYQSWTDFLTTAAYTSILTMSSL